MDRSLGVSNSPKAKPRVDSANGNKSCRQKPETFTKGSFSNVVRGGPKAVSGGKALQKLLRHLKTPTHVCKKLSLLVGLQQNAGDLVLPITFDLQPLFQKML
jgi:hypothetical protein